MARRIAYDLGRMSTVRWAIIPLFLISGAAGLVYEVTWTRAFGTVFGNTVFAVSTVLTAFMLGLAAGSWLFGKIADRSRNPVRLYAILAGLVGAYAFAFPGILKLTDRFYVWFFQTYQPTVSDFTQKEFYVLSLVRFVVSVGILILPTALMGATLPVLSRLWASPAGSDQDKAKTGQSVGFLYAVNTFGAVAGSFLAGYYLIRYLGVSTTIYAAGAANAFVGLVSLILSGAVRRWPTAQPAAAPAGKGKPKAKPETKQKTKAKGSKGSPLAQEGRKGTRRIILAAMALSGFCALALEVLWARVLIFVLGTSAYAFACMLTTFILGIAIGSVIGSRLIVPWLKRPVRALGFVEFLLAGSVLGSVVLLGRLWHIDLSFLSLVGREKAFGVDMVTHFLDAAVVILGPTILMGVAFPIAVRICAPSWDTVGKRVGQLYACNTIGCVVGSFAAGFILVPMLGLRHSFLAIVAIQFLLAVLILLLLSEGKRVRVGLPALVISVAVMAAAMQTMPQDVFLRTIKTYHYPSEVLFMKDGVTGTVTVHDVPDGDRIIAVDGVNVAGIDLMLRTTQKLQAYAPLLVHKKPKKVLQIGFGSGETCGIGVNFDESDDYEYTICEICPDVFEAGVHFRDINRGVYEDPRLRKVIMDGKNFVKLTKEKFDVIMNDSTYPGTTGSSALYTYDHFKQCREHLNPGGVLSCWVPIDLRPEDFAVIVRSFQAAMPYCSLWMVNNCLNKHAVIMGTTEPMEIEFQRVAELVARPDIAADLAQINILSAYDFLDSLIVGEVGLLKIGGLDSYVANVKELTGLGEERLRTMSLNTDDMPSLEFGASIKRDIEGCWIAVLEEMIENHTPPGRYIVGTGATAQQARQVEARLDQYYRGTGHALKGLVGILQGDPDIMGREFKAAREANPLDRDVQSCIDEMKQEVEAFLQAIERTPKSPTLRSRLAKRYMLLANEDPANFEKAVEQYRVFLDLSSGNPVAQARAQNNVAVCYRAIRQFEKAIAAYEQAMKLDPGYIQAYLGLGSVYLRLDDLPKMTEVVLKAIPLSSRDGKRSIYVLLARTHTEKGDYQGAIEYTDKAMGLVPPQSKMWEYLNERKVLLNQALEAAQSRQGQQ